MKSRILLVNFTASEQEKINSLGIDVDLGYISDVDKMGEEWAKFFSPLAIYEYKAIFIKLTKKPPLETLFINKTKYISEESDNFFKYWKKKKGILTIFLEDNSFKSLKILGIPYTELKSSDGRDATVKYVLDDKDIPFRQVFRAEKSSIVIPPTKYINIEEKEWTILEKIDMHICNIYENLNDQSLGVYCNNTKYYYYKDYPLFLILPTFKEYASTITKLLKVFTKIYPKLIPEIYEADWMKSDKYYPKEVANFNQQIIQLMENTEKQIKELGKAENEAKEKYSYLRSILYESGDELKNAIIEILFEIWKINAEDMDTTRKTNFREDVLIYDNKMIVLAEVKGTQDSNPTLKYITQLLTHVLKSEHKEAIGALILNHDLKKDPDERTNAYTSPDDEEQLKEIIYIDTRVLFNLSMAILDYGMPLEEAKKILFKKGRTTFDFDEYIKSKGEN